MAASTAPILVSFAFGIVGFLMGAGLTLIIAKEQFALKAAIVVSAALVLLFDFAGFRIIEFGSVIDPENPQRVIPVAEILGPRFAFLGFLSGIISFGISQRVQTAIGILFVGSIMMASGGGFGV
ncbi:MAG: hypothetical protein AAGH90_02945 [Pseudomonadota bacterium]